MRLRNLLENRRKKGLPHVNYTHGARPFLSHFFISFKGFYLFYHPFVSGNQSSFTLISTCAGEIPSVIAVRQIKPV